MKYNRVAVLRGGPSAEYEVSLKTGSNVLRALRDLGYSTKDITITKNGEWLCDGLCRDKQNILSDVDVVFIALHGSYGEDGTVQRMIKRLNLPYTGSDPYASAIAINKFITKEHLKESGIKMPKHARVLRQDVTNLQKTVFGLTQAFGPHYVIKPVSGGSSVDTLIAHHSGELSTMLEELLNKYGEVLVEEFVKGKEATVGILEGFRDQKHYVLPDIEIISPDESPLFSYEAKYSGCTEEICPGRFSKTEKQKLAEAALEVHKQLNLSQYSRSDFIISDGEVYFLEVNTLPGLTEESLFPKSINAIGSNYNELIDHLVKTARP